MIRLPRRVLGWGVVLLAAACSDAGTLANVSPGPSSVRRIVPKGTIDTLVLSDSISLEVDNRGGATGADLEIAKAGAEAGLPPSMTLAAVAIHVHAPPSSVSQPSIVDPAITPIKLIVSVGAAAVTTIRSFLVSRPNEIPLWTTATGTDYVDPKDGRLKHIESVSLIPPVTESTDVLVTLASSVDVCDLPPRLIDITPGVATTRTPLILIHGWQADMIGCRGEDVTWAGIPFATFYSNWDKDTNHKPFDDFLASLDLPANTSLRDKYHIYVLHYPTYRSVITTSTFLRDQLQTLPGGPPVILAHSMGGLVARGMMGLSGSPAVRALITLGTPHAGATIASVISKTSGYSDTQIDNAIKSCGLGGRLAGSAAFSVMPTNGLRDLSETSDLIRLLVSSRPSQERIYTLGGKISSNGGGFSPLQQLACITNNLPGTEATDGVVPTGSSVPLWSAGQHLLDNTNHLALTSSSVALPIVRDALTRFASCQTVTPPVTAGNPFIISGSIVRRDDTHVDITLNGILINGAVQTGLTKANFTLVENGCAVPSSDFDVTTGQGNVPVDLVFIQDLSGSMNNPIDGVRTSVISFAASLASQGLDVRFGSVGYSGDQSTIPSTPYSSPYEKLGPVRDLTDVNTFRAHVASQWSSGGGGDASENGLEAIEFAMARLAWRPGAARIMVDITNSGHHTAVDSCNGYGQCTDETLASITNLITGRAVLHAVAPAAAAERTAEGGLDPWLVASASGGKALVLGTGTFDLSAIGVTDAIAATTRLTFRSASTTPAPENLRILVTINGQTAELSPGLIQYLKAQPSPRQ